MSEQVLCRRRGNGLRVAFFVDAFPGLSITFIIDQIVALLSRGHDITIFAQHPPTIATAHPEVRASELLGRTIYLGPPTGPVRKGLGAVLESIRGPRRALRVLRQLRRSGAPEPTGFARLFFGAMRFPRAVRFDVAHCHFGPNGDLAGFLRACGFLHSPFVVTYHGYDVRRLRSSRSTTPYSYAKRFAARHLAISAYNRHALLTIGVPDTRIVDHPVAIDLNRFPYRERSCDESRTLRILTVANLVAEKGHALALDALAQIRRSQPELPFLYRIVGDGPLRAYLGELVRRHGLTDRVEFCGGLAREDVIKELEAADVFLLPSLAEATPVVLMEAQACGVPVVATKVGAIAEVVPDGASGILVEPADAKLMADALLRLLLRPNSWAAMGRRGRQHVEARYDLATVTERLERIYFATLEQ